MLFTQEKLHELSVPFDGSLPCGPYLKADKQAFRILRNEFNSAQTALRKLVKNPEPDEKLIFKKECHDIWSEFSDSLYEQFVTVTRDIELIAWFTTSQMLLDSSLDSCANSLTWLADLVEKHWDSLNPVLTLEPSQDDISLELKNKTHQVNAKIDAFSQFTGENETSGLLYAPILMLPLVGHITFFDYQSAERKGNLNELKFSISKNINAEKNIIQTKLDNGIRCLSQLDRIDYLVSEEAKSYGVTSANFSHVKKIFSKFNSALKYLSGYSPSVTNVSDGIKFLSDKVHVENVLHGVCERAQLSSTDIFHRDVAFYQLREISDYFRRTEPHSPVSYLLEKAIRWGYMPLPELLKEILSEQSNDVIIKIFDSSGLNISERVNLPKNIENIPSITDELDEKKLSSKETSDKSAMQSSSIGTALRW